MLCNYCYCREIPCLYMSLCCSYFCRGGERKKNHVSENSRQVILFRKVSSHTLLKTSQGAKQSVFVSYLSTNTHPHCVPLLLLFLFLLPPCTLCFSFLTNTNKQVLTPRLLYLLFLLEILFPFKCYDLFINIH